MKELVAFVIFLRHCTEAYSEPCQTSKMDLLFSQKAPS